MRKFTKNIVKEFKHSFGRFLAIMAIIALGVGFLIGLSQTTPDMKTSMSAYLSENYAYDIDVKSAYGLTQDDIKEVVNATDEYGGEVVSAYMPVVTSSVMASINGADNQKAVNLIGLDFSVVEGTDGSGGEGDSKLSYLNRFTLMEGSYPTAADEVVVERSNNYFEEVSVGDIITLTAENSTYGDIYTNTQLKVVGIVSTPDYFYTDAREVTTIGSGVVSLVMYGNYTPEDTQSSVYDLTKSGGAFSQIAAMRGDSITYTDVWVSVAGAGVYEHFYTNYKNYVLERAEYIEKIGEEICADINDKASSFGITANASWYVLDRASSNMSYISFEMNAEKVEDIAGVFPAFFIVVAALVALTSMTKMVEEDRLQIGALKALGYKEGTLMAKYLSYCVLACLIGLVVGILLGFSIMPNIFWNAYATMYYLPTLSLGFSWWLAIAVVFGSLAVTIIITIIACRATTKEKPSTLMQPKAPKPGKRILLEKCTPVWKRISFKWKATIRNIFRYKKNMILTLISVCGCTALILAGFGLGDSVDAVTDVQYGEIVFYDTIISYAAEEATADGALAQYLATLDDDNVLDIYSESGQLVLDGGRESVDLYVVDNEDAFANFVSLHSRRSGKSISLSADGIVIPENIATVYGIEAGDAVTYISGSVQLTFTVSAVCEYYTGSDVYISAEAFIQAYYEAAGTEPTLSHNTYLVIYGYGDDEAAMNAAVEKLLSDPSVTGVEFTYTTIKSFKALSETMSFVTLILIVCAGALAAIVLYNLTNINIDERRREIATLRVLGYTKREVAGYIYRESSILTLAGALLGLLGGWLLHMFVVSKINSVMVMFVKAINWTSYIWSLLITIGFAIVVYAFMLMKLYKIDMAESLKSNE